MKHHSNWYRLLVTLIVVSLVLPPLLSSVAMARQPSDPESASPNSPPTDPDDPILKPPRKKQPQVREGDPLERDDWFYSRRTAGDPNVKFTLADAAVKRAEAAQQVIAMKKQPGGISPAAFGGNWQNVGPNPIVQVLRGEAGPFGAMSGRIGALAIRSTPPYTVYLGAAQGGVWVATFPSPVTATVSWTPKTDFLPSLAIGALALAPSNEDIVYVGTGEGALSGDSYFGNGILKSTDGGNTFSQVGGTTFNQVSISKLAVDPTNPNHVYAAALRGRGGARRTTPPTQSPWGIWESTNGGVNWTLRLTATAVVTNINSVLYNIGGATDIVMDPSQPNVLYASILGQGISKTVDGGANWFSIMNGFPITATYASPADVTRFSLGISHPSAAVSATLYTGFDWVDPLGNHRPSTVWKSTDEGASWSETNTAVVRDYCGGQCFYDNVLAVDPISPTIVYVGGQFDYNNGRGGIYRSTNGGATWVDLGFGQHPDFHAIAVRRDAPNNVVIGNDGGVWYSANRGGRLSPGAPVSAVDWINWNGTVNPTNAAVLARTGLAITQFTSAAQAPALINRIYGGTQDNGTERKSVASNTWFDFAGGDGGQVLVDPTDGRYIYGTYFGISPWRVVDAGLGFFTNQYILNGINLNDRSEFYIPWVMDPDHPSRLYLGTFRVYRTDNAKAVSAPDVVWTAISPDLTTGCAGAAPNGARGCLLTAFGATAGAPALYTGSDDGVVYFTPDATVAAPSWTRVDKAPLPNRPLAGIAVDRSNYRVAYLAYNGFNAATPSAPGHVFKTTDAGATWTDISGNLPDVPVNSIILDATDRNTLYVGTDVGPLVTYNRGASWAPLGTGFPIVSIEGLDLNPFTRQLVAGTHGRGMWRLNDSATQMPALQVRKTVADFPVGPGSILTYVITLKNVGNLTATNISIQDPLPANTTFVSASSGGSLVGGKIVWSVPNVPAPTVTDPGGFTGVQAGTVSVSFTVQITSSGVVTSGSVITDDGLTVTSLEGASATGSPFNVTLAPANALSLFTPSQLDGTRAGQSLPYYMTVRNLAYLPDSYKLSVSGNTFTMTFTDLFGSPITQTNSLAPGATYPFFAQVFVPASAANNQRDTERVTLTSNGNPSVSQAVTLTTIAVTRTVLLVDQDYDNPDVRAYYAETLDSMGVLYNLWDLSTDPVLPQNYLRAHRSVVWFTGTAYPSPITVYEPVLSALLDSGGRLFMSGWDILDQSGGTTPFVHDYLHIDWDGTDRQNDLGTTSVTADPLNSVTSGLGTIPVDPTVLDPVNDFSDQITPIAPAVSAFLDDKGQTDALSVEDTSTISGLKYRVMFLAFPFEAMGTISDRVNLLTRAFNWFGTSETAIAGLLADNSSPTPLGSPTLFTATISAGTNVTYTWNFGDGTPTATGITSTHTYTAVGTFTATVTAQNAIGSATATTLVRVDVPLSGLTASNSSPNQANTPTTLTATLSTGTNATFSWNFGDGTPNASGAVVTHTYTAGGTYTATVTATNPLGSLSATTIVSITEAPIAGLAASNSSPTALGSATGFTATITAGSSVTYTWNFGDATPTAIGITTTHTYTAVGTYTATVTAMNPTGSLSATTIVRIDVPISGLAASNSSPTTLGNVTLFTATISAGSNVSFAWNFGDGTAGSGITTSHIYTSTGTFTATVTASNSLGSVSASTVVRVDVSVNGVAATSSSPTPLGSPTFFTATVISGTNTTFVWNFGDNTSTVTGAVVSHTYASPGTFIAIVTAANSLGSASAATQVTVIGDQITVGPTTGNTASFIDKDGDVTSVQVPPGAFTQTTTLNLAPVFTVTGSPTGNLSFAGHAFDLSAFRSGQPVPGATFLRPVTITVQYSDADVAGVDENTLRVYVLSGGMWVDAATTCTPPSSYMRDTVNNRLSVAICHLSQFAVFGAVQYKVYSPVIFK